MGMKKRKGGEIDGFETNVDLSPTREVPVVGPETVAAGGQARMPRHIEDYFGDGKTHQVDISHFVGSQAPVQSSFLPPVAGNLVNILTTYLSDCAARGERKEFEYRVSQEKRGEYDHIQWCTILIKDMELGMCEEFGTLTINAYDPRFDFVSSIRYYGRKPVYGLSQGTIELISTDLPVVRTRRITNEEGRNNHPGVLWRHDLEMDIETFAVGEIPDTIREMKLRKREERPKVVNL